MKGTNYMRRLLSESEGIDSEERGETALGEHSKACPVRARQRERQAIAKTGKPSAKSLQQQTGTASTSEIRE